MTRLVNLRVRVVFLSSILIILSQWMVRAEETVPSAWLDAIAKYQSHQKEISSGVSVFLQTIMQILDKEGKIEGCDTFYTVLERSADGSQIVWETDSQGIKRKKQSGEKDEKKGDSETPISFFEPFYPKSREKYRFLSSPTPIAGQVKISYQPITKVKEGFSGSLIVDTTNWAPVRIEGIPIPLQKHMTEATVTTDYAADSLGVVHPIRHQLVAQIKMLLFKKRIKTITNYLRYEPALKSPGVSAGSKDP